MALSTLLRHADFDALPDWADDAHEEAFTAFRRCAVRAAEKPYRSGSLGIRAEAFLSAYEEARAAGVLGRQEARKFFERHFIPMAVTPDSGDAGFVTGFYEPIVRASAERTENFPFPLLARPADLVDIDGMNRPAGFDPYLAFGRTTAEGVAEYYDRRAIELGALDGQGLEIAWLEDKVDAYFIHVQGAARLEMTDGMVRRVTYAAKSGHRFTGAGRVLVDLGEIPLADVTMQSIRRWLAARPERVDEILWQNRSYIFFREAEVEDPNLGPIAAAKVPLAAGRSVAVDRLLHTFGTPFFISAPDLTAFGGAGFRRLMIAQDTGSAITGSARGDLFTGSGEAAGEIAGVIRAPADFFALVPRGLVRAEGSR